MERIRRIKNADYTTISNVFLRDKSLSLDAKGFLTLVMSLPENWDFSVSGMVAIVKEGRNHVYKTIRELIGCGYCERRYLYEKGVTGKKVRNGVEYVFTETPYLNPENLNLGNEDLNDLNSKNLNLDNLNLDNLNFENGTQISKEYNKVKNRKNKELNLSFSSAPLGAVPEEGGFFEKNFEDAAQSELAAELEKETPIPQVAPAPLSPIDLPEGFRLVTEGEVLLNGNYSYIYKSGYLITNAPAGKTQTRQNIDLGARHQTSNYEPINIQQLTDLAKSWGCNGKSENYASEFYNFWQAKDWEVNNKGGKMRNAEKRFEEFVKAKTAPKKEAHPAYQDCVKVFCEEHERRFARAYIFEAKDGKAMNTILEKLEVEIANKVKRDNEKNGITTFEKIAIMPQQIIDAFVYILNKNNVKWVNDNFTLTNINTQFNNIINSIRESHVHGQQQQQNPHSAKSDNRAKSHSEIAYDTYRQVAAKYGMSVEELLARNSAGNV